MSEQTVKVEVGFGDYARAMDVFLPATLVTFGERTMHAHVPQSTVEKLKERNIPHQIVLE